MCSTNFVNFDTKKKKNIRRISQEALRHNWETKGPHVDELEWIPFKPSYAETPVCLVSEEMEGNYSTKHQVHSSFFPATGRYAHLLEAT